MRKVTRATWSQEQDRCMLCGKRGGDHPLTRLETHEIARGPHRKKALECPAAFLRVCGFCHGDKLGTITEQLAVKKFHDPECYDRVAVNHLRSRAPEAITEDEVDAALAQMNLQPLY